MSSEALPERVALLKQLTALFSESGCCELEFEGTSFSLKLKREPYIGSGIASLLAPEMAHVPATPIAQATAAAKEVPAGRRQTIFSGMTGLFFRASGPGKQPFVSVGDKVTIGQTLCLVEAMKMLNVIDSDCTGTVVEVLLRDGVEVSMGAPLFVIEVEDV